jgi:hypothetical protein
VVDDQLAAVAEQVSQGSRPLLAVEYVGFPIRTMGSMRRFVFRASRLRVSAFSSMSSARLASSHRTRDTTSGKAITPPSLR